MPRNYKRKTVSTWDKEIILRAIDDYLNDEKPSCNKSAKKYGIPEPTLRRYLKKNPEDYPENGGRFKNTFTDDQLNQLQNYITDIDKRSFGMTRLQCQRLVFDFAEQNGIPHRFNKQTKLAGDDWMNNFMLKYNFSIRKPEATSIGRLMAFNKVNVGLFFEKLKEIKLEKKFNASQIFNVDESGISSVPSKLPNVISPTGARRVAKIVSAERGKNITVVLGISATGVYVPPFLIFARKRMDKHLVEGAPPGSITIGNDNGWMNSESFIQYLEHFCRHVKSTPDYPILLILDNHVSHVSLSAIRFCREHNITMLGFPPHTTHRLQPLDVAVFGPLKTYYSQACDTFMVNNPGRAITDRDIGRLFGEAYTRAATVGNAIKGFSACGIEPFNSNIFSDQDFISAEVTERPISNIEMSVPNNTIEVKNTLQQPINEEPAVGSSQRNDESVLEYSMCGEPTPGPSWRYNESVPENSAKLPALPVAVRPVSKRRPRAKMPTLEITSSPVKSILENKEQQKILKELKTKERLEKRKLNLILKENKKNKNKKFRGKNEKRKLKMSSEDSEEDEVPYVDTDNEDSADEECIFCQEPYRNDVRGEAWIKCIKCARWAHEMCSGVDSWKSFICEFCRID